MIRPIVFTLIAATALAPALLRESNSQRLTDRAIAMFAKGEYQEAVQLFQDAEKISSTPQKKFNEGTARVAAGDFVLGSTLLSDAAADPALRADALYNRGTSALRAGALDQAVSDFEQVLRLEPNRSDAKRNLELALRRQQQQQSDSPDPNQQSAKQQQQQQQASGKDKPSEDPQQQQQAKQGQQDLERILQAVEQQEREELSRMRRSRQERRPVGW